MLIMGAEEKTKTEEAVVTGSKSSASALPRYLRSVRSTTPRAMLFFAAVLIILGGIFYWHANAKDCNKVTKQTVALLEKKEYGRAYKELKDESNKKCGTATTKDGRTIYTVAYVRNKCGLALSAINLKYQKEAELNAQQALVAHATLSPKQRKEIPYDEDVGRRLLAISQGVYSPEFNAFFSPKGTC
jgi:hypothetical protein